MKRIIIVIGVAGLVVFGGKVFADWQKKQQAAGSLSLPEQITQKIEDLGEEILGTALEVLPGGAGLKKGSVTEGGEVAGETEPGIVQQTIENQAQEIIETLKELPAEQLDQIKKQIFKDFCQQILEE